jgi:hypothetical protein
MLSKKHANGGRNTGTEVSFTLIQLKKIGHPYGKREEIINCSDTCWGAMRSVNIPLSSTEVFLPTTLP